MVEELIVNCLHLTDREDREILSKRQAKEQGYYIRYWEGMVISTDRKQGICLSFKKIIKNAKECGDKYCCIMEDDCQFFKAADGKLAWDYYLENMPEDFDIYFGMIYVGEIRDNRIISVFSAMTLFTVHERFYDFFLNIPDSCHVDRHLGLYSNQFKFMVCDKFVCEQDGSKSSNNLMQCDYTSYLKGRKIYGKD